MTDLFTIRTTSGRENIVIDMIYTNVKMNSLKIRSIIHPGELKGYVFIEAPLEEVKKAIHGVMHVKGVIEKPVSIDDIKHFFESKKTKIIFGEEDIVEIIGGPFKREKGKIQRIDQVKDEVTVELLEASIPIPVTISTELVRLVKRGMKGIAAQKKKEEEEKEEKEKKEEKESVFDNLGEEGYERKTPAEPAEKPAEEVPEETKPSVLIPEEKKEEPVEEIKPAEEPAEEPEEPRIALEHTIVPAREEPKEKKPKKIELSAKLIPTEEVEVEAPAEVDEEIKAEEDKEIEEIFGEKKEKKKKKEEDDEF
jgi:transcriptional antiterminator NusG